MMLTLLLFQSLSSLIQKYRITKRVGGGSFGDIYLGVGANGEKVRVDESWRVFGDCRRFVRDIFLAVTP